MLSKKKAIRICFIIWIIHSFFSLKKQLTTPTRWCFLPALQKIKDSRYLSHHLDSKCVFYLLGLHLYTVAEFQILKSTTELGPFQRFKRCLHCNKAIPKTKRIQLQILLGQFRLAGKQTHWYYVLWNRCVFLSRSPKMENAGKWGRKGVQFCDW